MQQRCPVARSAPSYDADFYDDDFIRDPYPRYAAMRDLGAVVWLPRHGNYAITRYEEVREALRNWQVFSSAKGVAGDFFGCDFLKGNTVASDPPAHDVMRVAMGAPLLPAALESIRPNIEQAAQELIESLVGRRAFDGIEDFARFLPLTVVTRLVGLPESGRENMLKWASAAFNILGIQNERGRHGVETIEEMRRWISTEAIPEKLKQGSWTARILRLVHQGEVPQEMGPQLIRDYINPSLDTTISATGQLIYQLGKNPDQWKLLQNNPSLVPNAVNEAVRLGTPIRAFSRTLTRDYELSGTAMPAGARAMILFASANRDERKFPNPDRFDITRRGTEHVGFGHGIHMCVGMHLARLEMESLLRAMIPLVDQIEVGTPTIAINNVIRAFSNLPVTFHRTETTKPSLNRAAPSRTVSQISAKVAARRTIAANIISLDLISELGAPLPPFEAGAHIEVELSPGIIRHYSLCNDPSDPGVYRIGILRERTSRGGSSSLHEAANVGSRLSISAPRNHFRLNEGAKRSLLFAAGIGITPILAMAHRLQSLGREFILHYSARSPQHAAFLQDIEQSKFASKVRTHFSDSQDMPRLNFDRELETPDPDTHIYICGPWRFIDDGLACSKRWGWSENNIHIEHFGADISKAGAPFTVIAKRSGLTCEVPPNKTIMGILLENGVHVESSCQSGVCGTCLTEVLEGIPEHRDLVQTEKEKISNRRIAVCCSRSKTSRLVLDI